MSSTNEPMARRSGFVGRTVDGERIWVEIELRFNLDQDYHVTVDHSGEQGGYLELSICGLGIRKGCRTVDHCGQIVDSLRMVDQPAKGWSRRELQTLAKLWDRWHLNGLHAAVFTKRLTLV